MRLTDFVSEAAALHAHEQLVRSFGASVTTIVCQAPTAQAARADAVISVVSRLWPKCFYIYERRRRPSMIGIKVLIAQMQPAIKAGRSSEFDIRIVLRRYLGADGYLESCAIIGNPRIGLDGRPVGGVTEEHALRARELLSNRRARRRARRAAVREAEVALDAA